MDLRKVKNDKKEIREKYMAISRTLYTHYITDDGEITDIKIIIIIAKIVIIVRER